MNDPVTYGAFSSRLVDNAAYEGPFIVPSTWLKAGDNVLAAEVHQNNAGSSDIVFGLALDTVPVSIQELEQRLQQAKAENPEMPVVVRGDSLTQYQSVMDVLDVLGRVGLSQVGLATKSGKK